MIPIRYVEPVFRPPSEAESLILPVTDGCSWNECTFCEMYTAPQKKFRARDESEVLESIRLTGQRYGDQVRRVFLADGDAAGPADSPPAGDTRGDPQPPAGGATDFQLLPAAQPAQEVAAAEIDELAPPA
jgi:radical SAM superfamily enzyme YgiQ (UPF0313 family)